MFVMMMVMVIGTVDGDCGTEYFDGDTGGRIVVVAP